MVRNYKRKTNRGNIDHDQLLKAAEAVSKGAFFKTAAREYNIDRMKLKRFVKQQQQHGEYFVSGYEKLSSDKRVLKGSHETELAAHIVKLSDMYFGISAEKCRKLAYEFAEKNGVAIPESWRDKEKAGLDWFRSFRMRHNLSLRTPEATSLARATAFNSTVVNKFFDNLSFAMDNQTPKFHPQDIYNCDESGCHTVQTPGRIVSRRGQKQVGAITSRERGELVTVVYAINAIGNVLPPMFIFPRVRFKDHFLNLAPNGSIGVASKSGWMNESIFPQYLEHVAKHTRCSKDHPILLILDNHESLTSLAAIDMAKKRGIVLLTIPPHTSHRLQPLDLTVFGPFKRAYAQAMDGWMRSNPGKTVSITDIPGLVKIAQNIAMIPRNIISGFESTGIFPYNRNIFTESDFVSATVYDQQLLAPNIENEGNSSFENLNGNTDITENEVTDTHHPVSSDHELAIQQPCSSAMSPHTPVNEIHPLPKAPPRKQKNKRKTGSSRILTHTPVRNQIEDTKAGYTKKTNEKKKACEKNCQKYSCYNIK